MSMLLKYYIQKVMTKIITPKLRQQKAAMDKKNLRN